MSMKITEILEEKLKTLEPSYLEISNDSYKHAGHIGDDGSGESHFSIEIHSLKFQGLSRIQRHRLIHELLKSELHANIHALAIKAKTPGE